MSKDDLLEIDGRTIKLKDYDEYRAITKEIRATSIVMNHLPKLSPSHPDYKDLVDASKVLTERVQTLYKKISEMEV